MTHKIELVARTIHEAEQNGYLWDSEPEIRRERFREYARNAINLLDEDINVLLHALQQVAAAERVSGQEPRLGPVNMANS